MRFQRSFWGAEQVQILIGSEVMTQNANISVYGLFEFCKKHLFYVMFFVFFFILGVFSFFFNCVITFEPIKI